MSRPILRADNLICFFVVFECDRQSLSDEFHVSQTALIITKIVAGYMLDLHGCHIQSSDEDEASQETTNWKCDFICPLEIIDRHGIGHQNIKHNHKPLIVPKCLMMMRITRGRVVSDDVMRNCVGIVCR